MKDYKAFSTAVAIKLISLISQLIFLKVVVQVNNEAEHIAKVDFNCLSKRASTM